MIVFPLLPIAQANPFPPRAPQPSIVVPSQPTSPPADQPSSLPMPVTPAPILDDRLPAPETLPAPEALPRQEILRIQEVRPLPGQLDNVPVFNSNSPELVMTEGVLLSTFPQQGMQTPSAHLNYTFKDRFDFFSHHISRAKTPAELRTLFQGVLVYNPGTTPAKIEVLQAASHLTRPDALYLDLPNQVEDPTGRVYAGPGSRVMNDILRGRRQGSLPMDLVVPPGEVRLLMNLPIPAGSTVTPTSNGRSTLMRLKTNLPVHMANLAMFAPKDERGQERIPTVEEWVNLLTTGGVAGPRDLTPTAPSDRSEKITYGRVAGVAIGSQWQAKLTDDVKSSDLTIPKKGRAFSYGISLLPRGTFGTGQVQSAQMVARYPDTAYLANGNYGIQYSLTLPLYNNTRQAQSIGVMLETPVKQDQSKNEVLFFNPPEPRIFYRGTVRLRYRDDAGAAQMRYVHLVQRRGQQGDPLMTLNLQPGERRQVEVDLLYPPDATPPQLLTVTNQEGVVQTANNR